MLDFQPVEFLASERWLISCWHRRRSTADGTHESAEADPLEHGELIARVASRWRQHSVSTAGDLGLLVLYELAQTYTKARRVLYEWHEQWELDFYKRQHETETNTLLELRGLIATLRERLEALNQPGMARDHELIWFAHVTDVAEAERVDEPIDRALSNLRAISDTLRESIDLVATMSFSHQSRQAERFQELAGIVAAVLLVPTLVAGIFGANTSLPGEGSWLGFAYMATAMLLSAIVTYALISHWRRRS